MKQLLPFFVYVTALWDASCKPGPSGASADPYKDSLRGVIAKVEKETAASGQSIAKPEVAQDLMASYIHFFNKYPKDSASPTYLFKAAQLSVAMHSYLPALDFLQQFGQLFPKDAKADDAAFINAFIYENHLHDTARARVAYNNFMAAYPQSPLVKDARASIENMGLSDEELIKKFEQQNGSARK